MSATPKDLSAPVAYSANTSDSEGYDSAQGTHNFFQDKLEPSQFQSFEENSENSEEYDDLAEEYQPQEESQRKDEEKLQQDFSTLQVAKAEPEETDFYNFDQLIGGGKKYFSSDEEIDPSTEQISRAKALRKTSYGYDEDGFYQKDLQIKPDSMKYRIRKKQKDGTTNEQRISKQITGRKVFAGPRTVQYVEDEFGNIVTVEKDEMRAVEESVYTRKRFSTKSKDQHNAEIMAKFQGIQNEVNALTFDDSNRKQLHGRRKAPAKGRKPSRATQRARGSGKPQRGRGKAHRYSTKSKRNTKN